MKLRNISFLIFGLIVLFVLMLYIKHETETYYNGCSSDLDCAEGLICKKGQCTK